MQNKEVPFFFIFCPLEIGKLRLDTPRQSKGVWYSLRHSLLGKTDMYGTIS